MDTGVVVAVISAICAIVALIYTARVSNREIRQLDEKQIGNIAERILRNILDHERAETLKQADLRARSIATDQIQVHVNRERYISGPLFGVMQENINRRLTALEQRFDSLPDELTRRLEAPMKVIESQIGNVLIEVRKKGGN